MAVVAGIVFFVVRAILALIPGLADRAPIKKWAALAALIVTAFYLVLSGAEVATQRSFGSPFITPAATRSRRASGSPPMPTAATSTIRASATCDPSGCIGKLADGRLVSHALAPDALEEDCERAVLIVTARDTPPGCAATVVGRDLWRSRGALALCAAMAQAS